MVGIVFEGDVVTFAKSLIRDCLSVREIRNNWISGKQEKLLYKICLISCSNVFFFLRYDGFGKSFKLVWLVIEEIRNSK